MQETMIRQGRRISDIEKKSEALARKARYESNLKYTLLRLRGSFADVRELLSRFCIYILTCAPLLEPS